MDKYINFKKIPDNIKRIKIDVGLSFCAPHSQNWLNNDNKNKDLLVLGFEPNPYNCDSILNNCINKTIDGNHIKIIPVALSDKNAEMDFFCMKDDSGTSSLYRPLNNGYLGDIKDIVKVPVFKLKDLFDIFDWDRFQYIEFIKIDAQGSDLDILKGAEEYLRERVVFITAEAEDCYYYNCEHNNLKNMKDYMESQNFLHVNHNNTKDPTFINKKFIDIYNDIYIYQN